MAYNLEIKVTYHKLGILADWLYKNPDCAVYFDGRDLVYSSELGCFMYRNIAAKSRKGWYKARGMTQWYQRHLDYVNSCADTTE